MKNLLQRFKCAFTAGYAAFKQPEIMAATHFSAMATIYQHILTVQESNRPLMFQVGLIMPENEKHAIATVWVGAGANSSPVKRIEELCKERDALRASLASAIDKASRQQAP